MATGLARAAKGAMIACMLGVMGCSAPAARGPAAPVLTADEQKIGETVRKYLLANPEVLDEVQAMRARKVAETDPRDFAIGPANAPVTIVEFMDYGCPACHAALDLVLETQKRYGDKVRFVFIELNGQQVYSDEAARAALAAKAQDKYFSLHQAFMRHQGPLTTEVMNDIARRVGVDVPRMRRDMMSAEIVAHIADNRERSRKLSVNALPTFKVNGEAVTGVAREELFAAIDAELRRAGSGA